MLRYHLLGHLTVERDGEGLELGPPKQRAVLAVLAQDAGRVVGVDRLLDAVWGEDHPPSVQSSLHANVSRLRRVLRDDESAPPPVVRRGGGYLLDVERAEVDVRLFLADASAATTAVDRRDWPAAATASQRALGRWRGEYLADLRDEEWVRVAAGPLDERRAGAAQDLVVGLLGTGDVTAALAHSTAMVVEQPLAERATWLHMIALHRAGRSPEALETFRRFAAHLDDELGLDAGPALRDLHAAILRQDPEPASWPGEAAASALPPVVEPDVPERSARPDEPTITSERAPLIGRDAELSSVLALLDQAPQDGARWVVLTGPPGIGKTRMADEVAATWQRAGRRIARGHCPDLDELPSWWPVRQLLRELDEDPGRVLAADAGSDGVDTARYAVVDRAVSVLRARLASGPLLLVVDDLHWADHASLTFLAVLAETVTEPGLAVVLTTRPTAGNTELDRLLGAVARRPGSRQLSLPPLGAGDVARLVESVSGQRPDPASAAELAERTGGTPFHVAEYARLPETDRRQGRTPAAVRTVMRRRFAGLPADVLATARTAAVLGEPIDVRLLAAVTGRPAAAVADSLDTAADLELLVPAVDGASYVFAHALLRDELAAEVPDLRRRRLHTQAAGSLRDAVGATDLVRRAAHLQSAGPLADPATAYEGFRAAAAQADSQWLSGPAAAWWSAALTAYDRVPDADPAERDELVATQVRALAWAGQGQRLLDALDTALVGALRDGRTGSVGRLAATLLRVSGSWPWPFYRSGRDPLMTTLQGLDPALRGDPSARARVLAVTAVGHCYEPDASVPDSMSAHAIELAEASGDVDVLADALLGRALTYAGVATRSAESIELLDRLDTLEHEAAPTDAVMRHNLLTMATMNLGRTADSEKHLHAGAVGADVLRMPISRVQLRWHEASIALWSGDTGRAETLIAAAEHAHRRTDLQQSGSFELARIALAWTRGTLAQAQGDIAANTMVNRWTTAVVDAAATRPGCDEALTAEVLRSEPDVWTSHGRLTLLAHAVADRRLVALAPALLDALAPNRDTVAALGQVGSIGPTALGMARLARMTGDRDAATAHLDVATGLARRSGGAAALLHCRLEAARWAVEDADRPDDTARDELFAIARESDERDMPGVAAQARALA